MKDKTIKLLDDWKVNEFKQELMAEELLILWEENFKQREKILDIMDSNIDARLALYGTDGTHG